MGAEAVDSHSANLRPLERRVLRLSEAGLDDEEIARRFRRSPGWVARVRSLAALHRNDGPHMRGDLLRPLERRLLRWRGEGLSHEALAPRFRRSAAFLERVEQLAHYKLHAG
jgi:hypothetical protein